MTPPRLYREFETGATRDIDVDKLDYEAFLSPLVLERYAQYMHEHRVQSDGSLRNGDNWQKGIPIESYQKSLIRHVMDCWKLWRGRSNPDDIEEALCGILFNASGYLFQLLNEGG